jgi:uncharacterized protein DUF5995
LRVQNAFAVLDSTQVTGDARRLATMRDQCEQWERTGDRRFVFLSCYATMTANMIAALRAGRFRDGAWVARFLARFADFYFVALQAYESGVGFVPPAWRHAHDLARSRFTTIEEDLILGINAHINGDLPFAVHHLIKPELETLGEDGLRQRHLDFDAVNDVIYESTHTVQTEVIDRFGRLAGAVDRVMPEAMRMADLAVDKMLQIWRVDVWKSGIALLTAVDSETFERIAAEIHGDAVRRVHVIVLELEERQRLLEMPAHELRHLSADLEGGFEAVFRERTASRALGDTASHRPETGSPTQ